MSFVHKDFVNIKLFSKEITRGWQRAGRGHRPGGLLLIAAALALPGLAMAQPFVVPKSPPPPSVSKPTKNNRASSQEQTTPRSTKEQDNSNVRVDNISPKSDPASKQKPAAPESITRAPAPMSDETQRDHKPD
ncbi:hypothetical protein K2X14_10520 [Acetobacter sp. TBRC 12305]|uniref:Uncharacterized protein n=1 Tax=Acetobacter garciniae TaxID=2817435 RepID=A0A939HP92_9PROT|nr:hypothetical protein [Acetobacter garciniae]MBO1325559.1 hypothetical protein [Acetobacter garciniae]MBX0345268.1 hypothetical protein [Acetobacter garciniae]